MIVIPISGKAGHGKDTFANILRAELAKIGKTAIIIHYADYLKYCLKQYYNWDGQKDEAGRTLLQHFGTEVVRAKDPDFWADSVCRLLKAMEDEFDFALIADARMVNEVEKLYDFFPSENIFSVRIDRYDSMGRGRWENPMLTEEQKQHSSETALDSYMFDFYVCNNYPNIEFLETDARRLITKCLGLERK